MSTKESLSNKTMLYLYPGESIVEEHQRVQWKIEENSINDKSFSSSTAFVCDRLYMVRTLLVVLLF